MKLLGLRVLRLRVGFMASGSIDAGLRNFSGSTT